MTKEGISQFAKIDEWFFYGGGPLNQLGYTKIDTTYVCGLP